MKGIKKCISFSKDSEETHVIISATVKIKFAYEKIKQLNTHLRLQQKLKSDAAT